MHVLDVGREALGQRVPAAGVVEHVARHFEELGALLVGQAGQVGAWNDPAGLLLGEPASRRGGGLRLRRARKRDERQGGGEEEPQVSGGTHRELILPSGDGPYHNLRFASAVLPLL